MTVEPATFFNFAYGPNMSMARLRARVPSARVICRGVLRGHQLVWHKVSKDGSGKCDVVASGAADAVVHGVVFAIDQTEKATLDRAEGLEKGYDERQVVVELSGEPFVATMYYATSKDPALKPYSWYRAHVLADAYEHELRRSTSRCLRLSRPCRTKSEPTRRTHGACPSPVAALSGQRINIDREFIQTLKVNEANKYYLTKNGDLFPREPAPAAAT